MTKIPAKPSLGLDGSALWDRLWSAGEKWLSPDGDYAVMELLCRATDEAEYLRRALALGEVPRHYVLPNGSFVSHPYVTQLKELRAQITAWLSAMGFSPTDRARLGLAEVRTLDALDELQRRREERIRTVIIPEATPVQRKEDDGRE
jgi:P27 family predicted phage terminase small subunit